jgi:hypothetical protein
MCERSGSLCLKVCSEQMLYRPAIFDGLRPGLLSVCEVAEQFTDGAEGADKVKCVGIEHDSRFE